MLALADDGDLGQRLAPSFAYSARLPFDHGVYLWSVFGGAADACGPPVFAGLLAATL